MTNKEQENTKVNFFFHTLPGYDYVSVFSNSKTAIDDYNRLIM